MDCRQFRENHGAYLDDTLPGIELVRMQGHIAECGPCEKFDYRIRRSLLVFRNLPSIEPSSGFEARLNKKLQDSVRLQASSDRSFKIAGSAVALLSAVMLAYIATSLPNTELPEDIVMPPVIASIPEFDIPAVSAAGPAIIASVSAGVPIWTAALYAEQAPQHFARPELTLASYSR